MSDFFARVATTRFKSVVGAGFMPARFFNGATARRAEMLRTAPKGFFKIGKLSTRTEMKFKCHGRPGDFSQEARFS